METGKSGRYPVIDVPEDPRLPKQRRKDRETIARQVRLIEQRRSDPKLRDEVIKRLQDGRRGRAEYGRIDVIGSVDAPVLSASDEFLLAAADLGAYQKDPLPKYRLVKVAGLKGRVYRVVRRKSGRQSREDASSAAARGLRPNFVTPMGIVMKALCGPENTAGPGFIRPPRTKPKHRVQVAVIDTGMSAAGRTDQWLTNLQTTNNQDMLDEFPVAGALDLGAGHGTFSAGIVQQLAPDADLRIYRALLSDGIGTEVDVALAMVRAARDGAQILNLSLGLESDTDDEPVALRAAVDLIRDRWPDVLIVAAAGNTGRSQKCWPGGFDEVTAVAALTQTLTPAAWSTNGDWVECSTIGEGVLSTYVVGTEDPLVDPEGPDTFVGPNPWALWTGTSFAAPQVTGAVAQIAQREGIPPRDALARLLRYRRTEPGYGRVVPILPPT